MNHAPPPAPSDRVSARATVAALGIRRQPLQLCGPVRAQGHMAPKPVQQTPIQTWSEVLIAIVAGAQGLVEIHQRWRADPGWQAACGRTAGAAPAVVQETREAWTETKVAPSHQAMDRIDRRHRRGDSHDDTRRVQGLEAAMTGRPCGQTAAFASQVSVAQPRQWRGQPRGRGLAPREDALVVARRCTGTTHLTTALHPVGLATAQPLARDDETRRRTRWRMAAGGGRVEDVNGRLGRGSQGHGQDDAGTRAQSRAARVTAWVAAPRLSAPQVGWGPGGATPDRRPVRRVAGRGRKPNGPWGVGGVMSTLTPPEVIALTRPPVERVNDPTAVWWADVDGDDPRGGGVATAINGDTPGVGRTTRTTKRCAAQQRLTPLKAWAHHPMVWVRPWLTPDVPTRRRWGIMRLVREVLHVHGRLTCDPGQGISPIMLNAADPLATRWLTAVCAWLESEHIAVTLGKT